MSNPHFREALMRALGQPSQPDVAKAVAELRRAIALHVKHMNGTAPTTGPAGRASQSAMMDMMKAALTALGGTPSGHGM